MRLALDTSVLIDVMRGRRPACRARLDRAREAGDEIRLSSVSLHELMYGALRSRRAGYHLQAVDALVADMLVDDWTSEDALVAARVRHDLDEGGQPIGPLDTLIAAHAIRCDAVLVTGNLRHFARIGALVEGLRLMDWSISDQPLDTAALIAGLRRPQED
jgi:tRNA(fMet)-specific endonuclease VapC